MTRWADASGQGFHYGTGNRLAGDRMTNVSQSAMSGDRCDWSGCGELARQHYGVEHVHTPTGEMSLGGVRVREGTTVHCCMKHGLELRRILWDREERLA